MTTQNLKPRSDALRLLLAGDRSKDLEPLASPSNVAGLLAALADLAGKVEETTGWLADAAAHGRLHWMPAEAADPAARSSSAA